MNYGVHAVMYFYFFLTAVGFRPKWDRIVTSLQISQMFVGIFVCVMVYFYEKIVRKRFRRET
jgi:elongation of very long chain fatty acids protein 6